MQRAVLKYAPDYWDSSDATNNSRQIKLNPSVQEYKQIAYEVKHALQSYDKKIKSITRNQNIHDYGQVILREQLLAVINSQQIYRVRRFITIKKHYLNTALDYNLDHRRCGKCKLVFQKNINCASDELVLVVQVVTTQPKANLIEPKNSSDFFIDYIVELLN